MPYYKSYKNYNPEEELKNPNKPYVIPKEPMDIPLLLSEKQARKIWGRGLMIDSPDQEILDYLVEFTRVNRIHEQVIAVEELKAQRGQVVTYLEPILQGERVPRWGYADPNTIANVQKMYIEEVSGTLYKYITKDSKTWPVVETWTKEIVKRAYYRQLTEIDTGWGVSFQEDRLKTREIETTKEVHHNLGCVPLSEMRNKQTYVLPMIDVWNWKYELATWYPVRGMIKNYYELIKQIMKKIILGKPKIVGELQPNAMEEVVQGDWGPYMHDFIFNLKTRGNLDGKNSGLEIVQSNLSLNDDFKAAQEMLRLILLQVGLSDPFQGESNYKSVSEIQSQNSTTSDTVNLQKNQCIDQFTRDYGKALIIGTRAGFLSKGWDGEGKPPFTLSFPPEDAIDDTQAVERSVFLINNSLSDHVSELSKMLSITKDEARIVNQEFIANNKATFEATSYQLEAQELGDNKGNEKSSSKGINNAK